MNADDRKLSLIRRAIGGDSAALTILLADLHEGLRRRIERRIPPDLRSKIDAEDVLQESYTEVFRHIRTFQADQADAIDRWIGTIAIRRLRNVIKHHRAQKRGGGRAVIGQGHVAESVVLLLDQIEIAERSPSRSVAGREAAAAVTAALELLPAEYRDAVRLVYLQGWSVSAAAEHMGITERAVHNLCYKSKLRLRDLLGASSRFLSEGG